MKKQYGAILDSNTLILSIHAGQGTTKRNGRVFNLDVAVNAGDQSPVVRCIETGKTFTMRWEDIIEVASAAGLFDK